MILSIMHRIECISPQCANLIFYKIIKTIKLAIHPGQVIDLATVLDPVMDPFKDVLRVPPPGQPDIHYRPTNRPARPVASLAKIRASTNMYQATHYRVAFQRLCAVYNRPLLPHSGEQRQIDSVCFSRWWWVKVPLVGYQKEN